ncbi:MAG: Ig domain protein group 2 domain protein, partial [Bacteroidetes bacterium]|nr:Ig domain protein group 2 domain protein [Bacteroidota bacterium]
MKKINVVIVFIFLWFSNGYRAQIIIEEEFNGGTTAPGGWIFTSITATMNSVSNYGKSQPSVVMDATGDQITSASFVAGTANTISFWAVSTSGAPNTSDIITAQYFNGSWNNCTPATFTFNTTTRMFEATFPNTATRVRLTYTKSSVNVAIDDFTVLNNTGTCTTNSFLWFTSIVYNSCNAACEGTDEFLSFQNGNSSLSLSDLEITVPTSGVGQEGTTFCGNSANPCDEFFTTNAAYVTALNGVAGCAGFFLSPPGNVIPANGRVLVFMGNPPSSTINFGSLCSGGGNYYCVFVSNTTNCAGRYSNNVNALRYTTIRNRGTGCSVERSFNPSLGINT